MAKLYEAFRRVNAAASSLEQLVTIILKAVRNLVNSEHNLLLFVDNSRDQLWTKWTLGTVLDNKVCRLMPLSTLLNSLQTAMSAFALFKGLVGDCFCVCCCF